MNIENIDELSGVCRYIQSGLVDPVSGKPFMGQFTVNLIAIHMGLIKEKFKRYIKYFLDTENGKEYFLTY